MNKLLLFFSIVFSFSVFAQKVDYDHTSKWFLGFNIGGAWQTTDVTNKTNLGYGLTLGKSYNYDYGRILSFDIRARYLTGKWRGQDFDTSDLSNYTISNGVLTDYKNTYGFTINNFETTVHRLGLELVIHANSFKDRTNIDPYIFGGIGLTWHQTYGDIIDFTSSQSGGLYNYDPSITYTQTELTTLMDGILDTPLDGSTLDKFRVGFMPSLGFGLGYQIGKYTTFGFEHKTTFTLIDDFDGYSKTNKYNDIYHYTSLYLNFRFRTNNNVASNTTNNNTNSSGKIDGYTTGSNACPKPVIRLVYPSAASTSNVKTETYQVSTEISNITSIEDIVFTQNGTLNQNGQYNAQTRRFTATAFLTPGMNTFEVSAKNQCGDAKSNFVINYTPCLSPIVSFTNPQIANGSTEIINYTITANVSNIQNGQLTLKHNNFNITNYNYNATSGLVQATVSLTPGNNTFFIAGKNECGEATQTSSINYTFCAAPIISFIQPTVDGTTVNSAVYNLNALIQNVNNGSIVLQLNNKTIPNPSFNKNTGTLLATLNLVVGINTITIKSTNSCGTDTKTITIDYRRCLAPQITLVNPSNSITTALNQTFNLSALVQNSTNITLTNNGSTINYNFNNQTGSLQAATTLSQGVNTFVITAINTCGTDVETFTVNYNPCTAPQVTLVNPSNSITTALNQTFNLSALVQNSTNITLTNNGSTINYNFNNQTGSLQAATTLSQGVNTFVITAINTCGTDLETFTVNYNPCVAPQITLVNPSNANTTANNQAFNLSALVQNSTNITLTKNGTTVNYNFNSQTGSLQAATTLNQGVNTFVITAINTCGTDVETFTVNYNPCVLPQISLVNPMNSNSTVSNQAFNLTALVQNSTNITLTKNGSTINYNFNSQTGSLQATTTLSQGVNTFVIKAINTCGTDVETFTVNYNPCVAPQVTLVNPNDVNYTTSNQNLNLSSIVLNSSNITVTKNGTTINYNFNNQTGSLQAATTLSQGLNTFVITAINACGTDVETFNVNYNPCVAPQITLVNPSNSITTANNQAFNLSALVQNSTNITLTKNGSTINYNFNSQTGSLQAATTLSQGVNTFVITAINTCGTDVETFTVNYNPCVAPQITLVNPSNSITTANNQAFNLSALVQNSTNITLTKNGSTINYNFNSQTGSLQAATSLNQGVNTFVITAINTCGTDVKTFTVNYNPCVAPQITMIKPAIANSIAENENYTIAATIQNSTSVTLTQNGVAINTNFNSQTGALQASTTLSQGTNTFVLTVSNSCGTDVETFTLNFTSAPCVAPQITVVNPNQTPFVADNNPFNFSAIASSLTNATVTLTQNGNAVTNLTINQTTGTIQKNCTLITGSNVFVLTVTNACGRDSKTIEINYNPCLKPVINFTIPNGTTVNNSQFNVTASIQHFTQILYKIQTNTTQEGINFTHNGQTSYDYTYNSETGAFSSNATLIPGLNTFVLTVTNPCGTTTATFTINYLICNKPTITAVQVSKNSINVSDSIYNFKAYLTGINSKQNCQLKLNNQITNIFDFNTTTNLLSATFKLKKGLNQLNVKVTSNCGEEIQNFSINYTPLKPVVTPIRPKPSLPETKPSTPESKPPGRGSGRNK
jgi:alpha-L-arabinofuranosidase